MKTIINFNFWGVICLGAFISACSSGGTEESSSVSDTNASSDSSFRPGALSLEDLNEKILDQEDLIASLNNEIDQIRSSGVSGTAGANCYDPMQAQIDDGTKTLADFDLDGDGALTALDCRGPQGEAGEDGSSGANGADGQAGANGISCFQPLLDRIADGETLESVDTNGDGQIGPLDCLGANGLACWEEIGDRNRDGIANVEDCRGDTGETGARGSVGATGDRGPRGFEGPEGIQGPPGRLILGLPLQIHGYDEILESNRMRTFYNNYDQAVLVTLTAQMRTSLVMQANLYIKYEGQGWPSNADIHMYTQHYGLANDLQENHFSIRQSHTFVLPPRAHFRIIVDENEEGQLVDGNPFKSFWIGNVKYTALEP